MGLAAWRPDRRPRQADFAVTHLLSGLTCTEDTGAQKGGFLRDAADKGIALVFPDTSPRGAGIQGEEDDWVGCIYSHWTSKAYVCVPYH